MNANQGNADAQYYVGYCYEKGIGVKQSTFESMKWYCEARKNGSADAESALKKYDGGEILKSIGVELIKGFFS